MDAPSVYAVEPFSPGSLSGTTWCNVLVDPELPCDTCSGEGDSEETDDDTASLCSWTTEQGDGDGLATFSRSGQLSGRVGGDPFLNTPLQIEDELSTAETCVTFVPVFLPMAPFWPIDQYYGVAGVATVESATGYLQTDDQSQTRLSLSDRTPVEKQQERAVPVSVRTVQPQADDDDSTKTTLIFRNFPQDCGRDTLVSLLDAEGFNGIYDFVHLPLGFLSDEPLGYAVVNFVSHDAAERARKHFRGFDRWPGMSGEPCEVAWNSPLQGLTAHVERYKNSPLMHHSVPAYHRPLLFHRGAAVAFPRPTARIRPPRVRKLGTSHAF